MPKQINSEDKKQLQRFINQVERLSLCNFFKNGKPKMALALGDELTKAIVPERQDFIEMLTILRPFIMDDEHIYFNRIAGKVRNYLKGDTSILKRLDAVHERFNLYKDGKNSEKYKKKYSDYISPFPDLTCDLGERTIFNILNLVMNGYYFHSDLQKQREIINFVKEQKESWLGSLREDDLAEESLIVNRQRVREAFKFRFYGLIIALASCVLELKDLIEEKFGLPIDEELYQESQILYDFLDI